MSGLKGLASDTIWYGLSSIVGRLINYFLVPLYTYVFLEGEYGIVTELYAYIAFLYIVYTYGMETVYFRFANQEDEKSIFNLCFSAIVTTSLLFSSILIIFGSDIAIILGYEGQQNVIYFLAAIITIDAVVAIPYARLRLENRAKKFALIKLGQVLITVFLNLFFYLLCYPIYCDWLLPQAQELVFTFFDDNFKIKYVFLSNMLANGTVLLFLTRELHDFKYTINFKKLKPILAYALPLGLMGLAGIINEMLSRTLLKYWLPDQFYPGQTSLEALGVFGACYKLSVFMLLGLQAFRYAAEPFFFAQAEKKDSPKTFATVMQGFVAFNAIVFMAVSLNLDPISQIFLSKASYREALFIVPFLLLAYFFQGIHYNLSIWYKLTDKTIYGAIITGIGAFITIILNYFLIPSMGYFGSAIATLVTFLSMMTLNYILGQIHHPIPYPIAKIAEYILLSCSLTALFYYSDFKHPIINIIVRNTCVVLFAGYIYLRERKEIAGKMILGIKLP